MAIASRCTVRSRPRRSTARTTSIPTCPRTSRSASTTLPINKGGYLDLPDASRVSIERAHMEEDTGKSTHLGGTDAFTGGRSLRDYNRSGVPLVEIVSGPDIRSSAQARAYASELRGILIATGASDGRMEEGSMRIDANVSVRKPGAAFGTRCEIKNLIRCAVSSAPLTSKPCDR